MIWKLLDGAEHGIIKVKGTLSCSILGKYQNILFKNNRNSNKNSLKQFFCICAYLLQLLIFMNYTIYPSKIVFPKIESLLNP